ncbi:hypothetical protein EMIT0196MI5_50178 [Pseudomonas sp. IT-196MI5]
MMDWTLVVVEQRAGSLNVGGASPTHSPPLTPQAGVMVDALASRLDPTEKPVVGKPLSLCGDEPAHEKLSQSSTKCAGLCCEPRKRNATRHKANAGDAHGA